MNNNNNMTIYKAP